MTTATEDRVTTLLDTIVRHLLDSPYSESLSDYSLSAPLWQQVRRKDLINQWHLNNQEDPAWRFLWDTFDTPVSNGRGEDALADILESMARFIYENAFEDGRTMGLLQDHALACTSPDLSICHKETHP